MASYLDPYFTTGCVHKGPAMSCELALDFRGMFKNLLEAVVTEK